MIKQYISCSVENVEIQLQKKTFRYFSLCLFAGPNSKSNEDSTKLNNYWPPVIGDSLIYYSFSIQQIFIKL